MDDKIEVDISVMVPDSMWGDLDEARDNTIRAVNRNFDKLIYAQKREGPFKAPRSHVDGLNGHTVTWTKDDAYSRLYADLTGLNSEPKAKPVLTPEQIRARNKDALFRAVSIVETELAIFETLDRCEQVNRLFYSNSYTNSNGSSTDNPLAKHLRKLLQAIPIPLAQPKLATSAYGYVSLNLGPFSLSITTGESVKSLLASFVSSHAF